MHGGSDNCYLILKDTDGNYCYQIVGYDAASAGAGGRLVLADADGNTVMDMRDAGTNVFCKNNFMLNVDNLTLGLGASNDILISHNGSANVFNANTSSPFVFQFAGTEKLRITSSGALLVGLSSPSYSGGDMQHEIKKNNNRTYTAPLMVAHSHLLLNNSDTTTNAFCGLGIRAGTGDGAIGFVYNGSANSSDFVIITDGTNNGVEQLRITNGGMLQIGGAVHTSGDVDTSNTRLSIKQTGNSLEDGIYIERSGERKGFYIRVNPSSGVGDALAFTCNNNGSKNEAMYIDRDTNVNLGVASQTDSKSLFVGGKTSYAVFRTHNNRGMEWNLNAINSPQNHSSGISGWVFLGHDYGANPYPVRTFKIATPESGVQGTRVYQVWHDGDSNYDYGGLWEIRINQWTSNARFESVSIRCVNGNRNDMCVRAYNDSNGIMIRPSTIWGAVYLRLAGYDSSQGYRGSSHCAVANNGALAIYNAQGTDSGTVPTSGSPVDVFPFDGNGGSYTGGRDIENSNWFAG